MPEKIPVQSRVAAEDRIIDMPRKTDPETIAAEAIAEESALEKRSSTRASLFSKIGKLKPLLPILTGGLRMVDHGAVQALAQVLHFIDGSSAAQAQAHDEVQFGLDEIQSTHRELRHQVQDQSVAMKKLEEQIALLQHTTERNAADHSALVAEVKSLGNLVRGISVGVGIFLVVIIALLALLLSRHG